jgi:hypothetical protein
MQLCSDFYGSSFFILLVSGHMSCGMTNDPELYSRISEPLKIRFDVVVLFGCPSKGIMSCCGDDEKSLQLASLPRDDLECGTSLTEQEHYHRIYTDVDDDDDDDRTRNRDGTAPDTDSKGLDAASRQLSTLESLRDALAADVLTQNGQPCTMFASPFRLPNKQQPLDEGEKGKVAGSGANSNVLHVPLVYCDQTASNRPVRSIERYMEQVCLPLYGNTHTNTSITGSQRYLWPDHSCGRLFIILGAHATCVSLLMCSTAFVAEARQIVAEETNAKITGKASLDVVLFAYVAALLFVY